MAKDRSDKNKSMVHLLKAISQPLKGFPQKKKYILGLSDVTLAILASTVFHALPPRLEEPLKE